MVLQLHHHRQHQGRRRHRHRPVVAHIAVPRQVDHHRPTRREVRRTTGIVEVRAAPRHTHDADDQKDVPEIDKADEQKKGVARIHIRLEVPELIYLLFRQKRARVVSLSRVDHNIYNYSASFYL